MTTINSLYESFGLSPSCTDDELRRAYHRAMLQHHPDRNPDQVETATIKTQQLNVAYDVLKKYREDLRHGRKPHTSYSPEVDIVSISIEIVFKVSTVDIEDIARRKSSFRKAWETFRQNPSDPIRALHLVHAAFDAGRQDAIYDLLRNPILVDAAPLLLSWVETESACETLIRWGNILYQNQLVKEGIQILEDTLATGKATWRVAEELRGMHYHFAQGHTSGAKGKPAPAVRVEHLNRILELGFEYGYIYKLLAEAYHELGDDAQARAHLEQAYKIDSQLLGAVRISRALGFLPAKKPAPSKAKTRAEYKYSQPEHIPPPSQIRKWAASGKWNDILAFADLADYSPRILSKSRSTIRQIASSLGGYTDIEAQEALTSLLDSGYWDAREASVLSLSKIGDQHALHLLQTLTPRNSREETCLRNAISYLQARMANELPVATGIPTTELIGCAEQAFATNDYGQARFLIENIVTTMEQRHPLYFDALVLLARACDGMTDSNEAIRLIKPVLSTLPAQCRRRVSQEMTIWLWSQLVFEPYDPANDEDYLLALNILLEHALTAITPGEVLSNLKYFTRWMEMLGEDDIAQWIRSWIRIEAPGTWYVDRPNREQYARQIELSEYMRGQLVGIHNRIKSGVPNKLSQVLQSPHALAGSGYSVEQISKSAKRGG